MPGAGKSTFMKAAEAKGIKVSDSDSQRHHFLTDVEGNYVDEEGNVVTSKEDRVPNPRFVEDYLAAIQEAATEADLVFVSTHQEVRDALRDAGVPFALFTYDPSIREEVVDRIRTRKGPQPEFVNNIIANVVDSNWDNWVTDEHADGPSHIFVLGSGEFIGNVLTIEEGSLGLNDERAHVAAQVALAARTR